MLDSYRLRSGVTGGGRCASTQHNDDPMGNVPLYGWIMRHSFRSAQTSVVAERPWQRWHNRGTIRAENSCWTCSVTANNSLHLTAATFSVMESQSGGG